MIAFLDQLFGRSLWVGGVGVVVALYLISATLQAIAIYHVAKKVGLSKGERVGLVVFTIVVPFGVELSLLFIAFKMGTSFKEIRAMHKKEKRKKAKAE